MPPTTLPTYVERGGGQVWRPPYAARSANLLGLVVPTDPQRIDAMLQRDLVLPSGGEVDYRAAHANLLIVCADIDRMSSKDPVDALRGSMPEQELSVWCLVADKTAGERLVWYLPYVYADGGRPVAAGREVYGYPKELGTFDQAYPQLFDVPTAPTTSTISAVGISKYGPNAVADLLPIASVTRQPGTGTPPPKGTSLVDDLLDGIFPGGPSVSTTLPFTITPGPKATISFTPGGAPGSAGALLPWIRPTISKLLGGGLTGAPEDLMSELIANPSLVFLKQFRDACCPTKACYQAIVEAPIAASPANATFTPLDPKLFGVTVHEWASDPVATDLGLLPSTPITPAAAFRATLDFDVMTGYEVWKAPT